MDSLAGKTIIFLFESTLTSPYSMNFPKLAYIESGMLVGSAAYSYVDPEETDPSSWEQYPPMEINFPSLTYSACVLIWGNISRSD
jgi:hypothetical protein